MSVHARFHRVISLADHGRFPSRHLRLHCPAGTGPAAIDRKKQAPRSHTPPHAAVWPRGPARRAQGLVRTTASAARVLERRPMDDALVVSIRIARGGKARPVPGDGSEKPEILRVQDVRRQGWTVVGAEQEVPVDPVNDLIAGHRGTSRSKGTDRQESRCARPGARPCALRTSLRRRRPVVTAPALVTGNRRLDTAPGSQERRRRIRQSQPLGTALSSTPRDSFCPHKSILVSRGSDDGRHPIERAVLVQRPRLVRNVETVDDRSPGDPRSLGELLLAVWKCEQDLPRSLPPACRQPLARDRCTRRPRRNRCPMLRHRRASAVSPKRTALDNRAVEVGRASGRHDMEADTVPARRLPGNRHIVGFPPNTAMLSRTQAMAAR